MDDLDREIALDARQAETFIRLHRLVRRGYVPELGDGAVEDAIFLRHLAAGPMLILYPCGMVVAINGSAKISPRDKEDPTHILNEDKKDERRFREFLATVREPTWRERTRPDREKYILMPGCLLVIIAASWAFVYVGSKILKSIFGP